MGGLRPASCWRPETDGNRQAGRRSPLGFRLRRVSASHRAAGRPFTSNCGVSGNLGSGGFGGLSSVRLVVTKTSVGEGAG